jgi:hypothetical protein
VATDEVAVAVAEPLPLVPKTSMATRGIFVCGSTVADCRLPPGVSAPVGVAWFAYAAFFGASFGPQPHATMSTTRNARRSIPDHLVD